VFAAHLSESRPCSWTGGEQAGDWTRPNWVGNGRVAYHENLLRVKAAQTWCVARPPLRVGRSVSPAEYEGRIDENGQYVLVFEFLTGLLFAKLRLSVPILPPPKRRQ
jgi:hypothetical protein